MPRSSRKPPESISPLKLAEVRPRLFVGTSGWAYSTWKPGFYPEGLGASNFLPFYASKMNSVEVNYTFRALPTAKNLGVWLASVPDNFRFTFKAPQRITHFKRLRDCETDVAQFVRALGPVRGAGKLGLLLFQLPPNFKSDFARLRDFLSLATFSGDDKPQLSFEFRHESWFAPEIGQLLQDHDAAFCVAESDDLVTPEMHPASSHTSFRLRRNGGYKAVEIAGFAEKFMALSSSRDVYIYFKHEDEPTGALNAVALVEKLRDVPGARS